MSISESNRPLVLITFGTTYGASEAIAKMLFEDSAAHDFATFKLVPMAKLIKVPPFQ
jgi:flavodoxin